MRHLALIFIVFSGTVWAGTNQWTRVSPEGGRVLRLAVDPHMPSTVYAVTCADVFKSVNAGASWTAVSSGLPTAECMQSPLIDAQGTVYARTRCEIFKTTDAGASWSTITSELNKIANCIVSIAIDSANPGTLYAGGNGLFKTVDGGLNWTEVTSGFQSGDVIRLVAVDPKDANTIYAIGFRGLFRSTDGGAIWSPANSGLAPNIESLIIDPQNSGTLYASSRSQISKSTNGGVSWSDISPGLPPAPAPANGYRQLLSLAINPQTPAVLYALIAQHLNNMPDSFFLVTSADAGARWTLAGDPTLVANDLNTITPDPQAAGTLYLGTNQGVLKSTDGGRHWDTANSGMRATAIRQVVADTQTAGTLYAVNGTEMLQHGTRLFKSTDAGSSWVPSDAGLESFVFSLVAEPQNAGVLYMLGSGVHGLYKSDDAGASWSKIWGSSVPATSVNPLAIDPQNPDILYAGVTTCTGNCFARIAKSIDAGRTWSESHASLKGAGCCSSVSQLAVDPQDANVVYAGTADFDGSGSGLWKSTDAGASWVNLTLGDIDSIVIDPRNAGTFYFSGDGAVYKSTDGGQTWAQVNSAQALCCEAGPIAIDPQDSNTLYYAGAQTVFRSTDAGGSWTSFSSGLTGRINSLASIRKVQIRCMPEPPAACSPLHSTRVLVPPTHPIESPDSLPLSGLTAIMGHDVV